jgi:catechol-2,3-dioxygenase
VKLRATIGHIGLNLSSSGKAFAFWKDLLKFLGFSLTEDGPHHFDASDGNAYLCINVAEKGRGKFHRRATGLNHIAFRLASRSRVDQFVKEYLEPRKIKPLYGGAKEYPTYAPGYYAVYFEDPDRIKVEVVFEPVVVGC